MDIKRTIKNNVAGINYLVPFLKRYKFGGYSPLSIAKNAFVNKLKIKGYKASNNLVGNAWVKLFSHVKITIDSNSPFVYFIDEKKTLALKGNILGNFTIDYSQILETPFLNIVNSVKNSGDYGKEASHIGDALSLFVKRITNSIEDEALPSEQKNKKLNYFKNMLDKKATHFDEALQRILFFNQILWQTGHRLNGIGRLDKILDTYFDKDIKSGYITLDEAKQFVREFMLALSTYSSFKSDNLIGDIGQIILIGGVDEKGEYFNNPLTEIILQEHSKLKKPDPKLLLRCSSKMPDKILDLALNCLTSATGSPLFSNDDVVIPALISSGIDKIDAYNYCTSACWEPFIVGKSFDQNNISTFDYFEALESAVLHEYFSFNDLVDSYIEINNTKFKDHIEKLNAYKWAKDPFVSLLTKDCNKFKTDITLGGSKYKNFGITTVGLGNVVNSLINIKKLVYDSSEISLHELNNSRLKNYSNNEPLNDKTLNSLPSFGSDDSYTIQLTNKITGSLSKTLNDKKNSLGGSFKIGLSSPSYLFNGKYSNADFANKRKGAPYLTHISADGLAYTEVASFASKLNYKDQLYNGNVLDIVLNPNIFKDNKDKLLSFLKAAIKIGVFQFQFNIIDSDTLIAAKKHPEKYPNLIVRVWGFSAYFKDLPESYQDLMIQRALKSEGRAA